MSHLQPVKIRRTTAPVKAALLNPVGDARPHASVELDLFRCHLLSAFRTWIVECHPAPVEVEVEMAATIKAMRQIQGMPDPEPPLV